MNRSVGIARLYAFNGGFVDTVGLLGLHGLFLAHVTGNIVTLAAALMTGAQGTIAKALALPEFMATAAAFHAAAKIFRGRYVARRLLFNVQTMLLACFFALAVTLGPFTGPGILALLITASCGIAAMAAQNALLMTYLPEVPPTTFMSGNVLRAVMDAVDISLSRTSGRARAVRDRLSPLLHSILAFILGCGAAALLFHLVGFWCLILPIPAAIGATRLAAPPPIREAGMAH